MKDDYDFSQSRKNQYAKNLKTQITLNIDNDTMNYFKTQSEKSGVPYQTLINLYLSDCATQHRSLKMQWE